MNRVVSSTVPLGIAVLALLTLVACGQEVEADGCDGDADCETGQQCIDEQCVDADEVNECGGVGELDGEIGDPCGPCDLDQLECAPDRQSLVCDGETECPPLDVVTQQPSNVEARSVTFAGELREMPPAGEVTEVGFCWTDDGIPTLEDQCLDAEPPAHPGKFEAQADGFDPGSTYSVAAYYSTDARDRDVMNDVEFTTAAPAPEGLEAQSTREAVVLSWDELDGATAVRVYADDEPRKFLEDPTATSFDDDEAPAGSVTAPDNPEATDDDPDQIEITWEPAESSDGPEASYHLVAEYPDAESEPTETVTGYRAGPEITGYELLATDADDDTPMGDDDWIETDSEDSHVDDQAPRAEITAGETTASDGTRVGRIVLETDASVQQVERTYRLRATWGDGGQYGEETAPFTGVRPAGELSVQWERSDDEGSTFDVLDGVTGTVAEDTNFEEYEDEEDFDWTFHYQAELTAAGADPTTAGPVVGSLVHEDDAELGTVEFVEIRDIGETEATLEAELIELGNPPATEHGFCWLGPDDEPPEDPPQEYTDLPNCVEFGAPDQPGSFETTLTDLEPGEEYHVGTFIHHQDLGSDLVEGGSFETDHDGPALE